MKLTQRALCSGLGCLIMALSFSARADAEAAPGFTPLFDGRSLNGWRGDARAWRVVDGAIVGRSNVELGANTFLVYEKPFGNFELRYKYRWKADSGNSGVQFRSHVIEGNYAMTGLQANVIPVSGPPERFGMLYDETGDRQEMALLGQRATITRGTKLGGTARIIRTVQEMVNSREDILDAVRKGPEWTEVVVVAYDNHIVSAINGLLAFDAWDNDPVGSRSGLIGLQFHHRGGAGTWVEYKDIEIKPLTSSPSLEGRFKSKPQPAPEPRRTYKESTRPAQADIPLD